jgi:predicted transcriptional regulator of viral defense system
MKHNTSMQTSNQTNSQLILTAAQARAQGISSTQLTRMTRAGKLHRIGRGLYASVDASVSEHRSLAEVRAQGGKGVVCLLSALRYHDITTQAPFEVWLAIGHKDRSPAVDVVNLRVFRFSGAALTQGIGWHTIDGIEVPVYGVAKTVADCFKFRHKIGIDVAIEALRCALAARKATPAEIMGFAHVCRVANVIRPYLEASV